MENISVIGAGAWGTALAQVAARAGRNVKIWSRSKALADSINQDKVNGKYLPNTPLEKNISATNDLELAVKDADAIMFVVPVQHTRMIVKDLIGLIPEDVPLVLCSKGIELNTGLLMSQVVKELFPDNPYIVLSGPNFASEIAKGLPAATALATLNTNAGNDLAKALGGKTFRPYVISDPIGAEIGGAIKNVIAIACGIVAGSQLGENAKAAIMTRGMAEMKRMGKALGAKPETFLGLSGMGDLTLTCNSSLSRNYQLGFMLGQGKTLESIMENRNSVVEGVATATAVLEFAKKQAVNMPICQAINDTLHSDTTIAETVEDLMTRPLTQSES